MHIRRPQQPMRGASVALATERSAKRVADVLTRRDGDKTFKDVQDETFKTFRREETKKANVLTKTFKTFRRDETKKR